MLFIVDEGQSIQHAVDVAAPGDTIQVRSATFAQHVIIPAEKERLFIIGEGAGKSILDGTGLSEASGFTIEAAFVTVAGFTVRNFEGSGIVIAADDAVVRENDVQQNAACGIHVCGDRNLLANNAVTACGGDGVRVETGRYNYLIGNRVGKNGQNGLQLAGAGSVALENVLSGNTLAGILVAETGALIVANRVHDHESDGIVTTGAVRVLLYGNMTANNRESGMELSGSGILALRNRIINNGVHGLLVQDVLGDSLLYHNVLSFNGGNGLHGLPGVTSSLILENVLERNAHDGLEMLGATRNRLLLNQADRNNASGYTLGHRATHNLIDDNTARDNAASGLTVDPATSDNAARQNQLAQNQPYDLVAQPPAPLNNVIEANVCGRSLPSSLSGD